MKHTVEATTRRGLAKTMMAIVVGAAVLLAPMVATAAPMRPEQADSSALVIDGHGAGHGVGMSQWGAYGYAADQGWSAAQILDRFYGGTVSTSLDTTSTTVTVRLMRLDELQTAVVNTRAQLVVDGVDGGPWGSVVAREVTPGSYTVWARNDAVCPNTSDMLTAGWVVVATGKASVVVRPLTDTSVSAAYADLAGVCEPSGTVRSYRGIIRAVNGTDGSNHTVNEVPVEQYLRSVVASEMSPAWAARGSQALQAQAIASRTYALNEKRYSYARTCDMLCQSYPGAASRTGVNGAFRRNEWPSTDAAVTATVGVVRRLGSASGQLAYTMFSSSSGGYSASNGLGFPVVADAGDATPTNPYHSWTATVTYTAVTKAWPSIGTFTGITVAKRSGDGDWGGRVLAITVSGTAGSVTLTGDAFRRAVGMKSNWFSIRPESIPGGVDSSPPEPTTTVPVTTVPVTTVPVTTTPVTTVPAPSGASCGNRVPPSIDGSGIATAGSRFTPTAPRRVVDTRDGTGTSATPLGAGCTLVVRPGVAGGATAVAVNLVTVNASASGYLTAYPCRRARPLTSAVQSLTGRVVSGSAIVPLAADGTFCIYSSAATDVVVDVFGAFAPGAGSLFEPIAAARLLDTRTSGRLVGAGQVVRIATRGTAKAGADDSAVSLTVHALGGTGSGFVTLWPCDAPRPLASSLNITAGTPVSNAVEVATNTAGEVCAYSSTATHLMVDLQGWYGPSATTEFHAVVPYRLVDSRSATGWSGMLNPGASKRVGVAGSGGVPASGVRAAVFAVTTVGPGRAGYLTGFSCQTPLPAVSMLRYPASVNVAVSSTQMLCDAGDWCASASTSTNVVVDVNGWFG